ncbi:FAD-dependent oxidoreductase, partial [Streptomyces decoyicus]
MPLSASEPYDLAVIGAGSAGLAGAVTAGELGLSVVLLDTSTHTGGQFYRTPAPALGAVRPEALHHDWSAYADLRRRLAQSDVRHLPGRAPGDTRPHVVHRLQREAAVHRAVAAP